jgi:predicted GIY-YIG superfamily endonuclease
MLNTYTVVELTCNTPKHCFIGFAVDLESWLTRHRSGMIGFTRRHGIKDCRAVAIYPSAIEAEQARDALVKVRQDEGSTVNADTYVPVYHLCEIECETPDHFFLGYSEHFDSWLARHKERTTLSPFTQKHGVRSGRVLATYENLAELKKAQAERTEELLARGMTVNGRVKKPKQPKARRVSQEDVARARRQIGG